MFAFPISLLLSLAALSLTSVQANPAPDLAFDDVTTAVGIVQRENRFKWGGPCIADLDADGIYDMVLSYHASAATQIYWGNPDGTFTLDAFRYITDIHGINVAPRTARSQERLLAINVGGARGKRLRPPSMFLVTPDRTITNITNEFGFGIGKGRGRVTLFMDLSLKSIPARRTNLGGPDLFVLGFSSRKNSILQHAYENIQGNFSIRDVPGIEMETEGRADVIDLNNDRKMEVISFPATQIYQLNGSFSFEDVTSTTIRGPRSRYSSRTVSAISEFDFDNNGRFDLYVARALRNDVLPSGQPNLPISDVLFRWSRRRLVDISQSAGIPNNTRSLGVTAGDFDNNGYVDLFVALANEPDMFLLNNGNGTFTRVDGLIPKEEGIPSDHAVAVDYNQDGRLDLVVGQGVKLGIGGPYRVMKSILPLTENRHWLLVRVGHHPGRFVTALHATVTVRVGGMKMIRRVGSAGTQSGGPSFLDTLHFGLGSFTVVDEVRVRWTVGGPRIMKNVAADQKVTFGIVN